MSDLADKLRDLGIVLHNYEPGEHATTCPQCSAARKKSRAPCLSVKVDEAGGAAWWCAHCEWKGNVPSGGRPRRVYRRPEPIIVEPRTEQVLKWFADRGISAETATMFRVHVSRVFFPATGDERQALAFPYIWRGELVNVKYRGKDDDGEKIFIQEKDAEPTLYNIDALDIDELYVVEGEPDVMACTEVGYRSVVSLPVGAGTDRGKRLEALATHASQLKRVKKIIIAVDADEAGEILAEALAQAFGRDRCWRVRYPEGCKDANEVLTKRGSQELVACLASARPWPMDGVYTVSDFYSEVLDLYHGRSAKPISTCLPGMDSFWRIMPHSFNVITGIPNHGKSNVMSQIMVDMGIKYGWCWVWFCPEQSKAQNFARLAEKFFAAPFYDGPTQRISEAQIEEFRDWCDRHILFIESGETRPTIPYLLERARWAALRMAPVMQPGAPLGCIIDPWNATSSGRGARREDEWLADAFAEVKRFNRAHNAVFFVVCHPTKLQRNASGDYPIPDMYDCSGGALWYDAADAGIVVHRDFTTNRTKIVVRKIREQGPGGQIGEVEFDYSAIRRRYE